MGRIAEGEVSAPSTDWSVILAGGNGERLQDAIRRWLGEDVPKQYCAFLGGRSMLHHTLRRACGVVSRERIVSVIGPNHRRFLDRLGPPPPGRVLESPRPKGTAVGIFFALSYILTEDPDAMVYVFPSDHFIFPEDRYVEELRDLRLRLDKRSKKRVVLLAARPDRPETDYGWIEVDRRRTGRLSGLPRAVRFIEKPRLAVATKLHRAGALWNTMIVLARAGTLWDLGVEYLPEVMLRFESFARILKGVRDGRIPSEMERVATDHLFTYVDSADFSRDLLRRAASRLLVHQLDVEWCDWGRPERVSETVARFGSGSAFPASKLSRPAAYDREQPVGAN
jgi:mannose-1-phosphate guanylyltransferase